MTARKIKATLLTRSLRPGKKMTALIEIPGRPSRVKVHFGAQGYSDYTIHRDRVRMQRYLARHRRREDWTFRGIHTPGFWSRWILWNRPSLAASVRDLRRRFGARIQLVVRA